MDSGKGKVGCIQLRAVSTSCTSIHGEPGSGCFGGRQVSASVGGPRPGDPVRARQRRRALRAVSRFVQSGHEIGGGPCRGGLQPRSFRLAGPPGSRGRIPLRTAARPILAQASPLPYRPRAALTSRSCPAAALGPPEPRRSARASRTGRCTAGSGGAATGRRYRPGAALRSKRVRPGAAWRIRPGADGVVGAERLQPGPIPRDEADRAGKADGRHRGRRSPRNRGAGSAGCAAPSLRRRPRTPAPGRARRARYRTAPAADCPDRVRRTPHRAAGYGGAGPSPTRVEEGRGAGRASGTCVN